MDEQVRRGGDYNATAKSNLPTEGASYLGYDEGMRKAWTGFRIACYPED